MIFDKNAIANYALDNIIKGNLESDIGYSFSKEEYFELDQSFEGLMKLYNVDTREEAFMMFQKELQNKSIISLTYIKEDFIKQIEFLAHQLDKTFDQVINHLKEDEKYKEELLILFIKYAKKDFDAILNERKRVEKELKKKNKNIA